MLLPHLELARSFSWRSSVDNLSLKEFYRDLVGAWISPYTRSVLSDWPVGWMLFRSTSSFDGMAEAPNEILTSHSDCHTTSD